MGPGALIASPGSGRVAALPPMREKALMKPFYCRHGITIYRGNSRSVLPQFPPAHFDLVLSDPPWGISYPTNHDGSQGGSRRRYKKILGDDKPFDPSRLLAFERIVLWGAPHFANALPRSDRWLVWDKRQGRGQNDSSDCELAWTRGLTGCSTRAFYLYWSGCIRTGERGQFFHPTQKPVSLMRWCIGLFPGVRSIIDPYMGAGSSLIAARTLGLQAVGIELDKDYCRIAAERLEALEVGRLRPTSPPRPLAPSPPRPLAPSPPWAHSL